MALDWARKLRDPIRFYSSKALEHAAEGDSDLIDILHGDNYIPHQLEGMNAGNIGSEVIYHSLQNVADTRVERQRDIARIKRAIRR